ncbi:MAG: hypothetical protein ABIH26_04895 [Candidatus Eisenbacteria bacterium]
MSLGRKRAGRFLLRRPRVCLLLLIPLFLSGCLSGPDDEPARRTLQFSELRFSSPISPADTSATIEAGYYVGPTFCWAIEEINVSLEGRTIRVSGTAVDRSEGQTCGQALSYGQGSLSLPPLDPGTYLLRAGSLHDTLVVSTEVASSSRRFVARGDLASDATGCGDLAAPPFWIGLSDLPDSLPTGEIIVWGEELDEDPCGRSHPEFYDFFASVRRVAAAPT